MAASVPAMHAADKKTPPVDGDPYKFRVDGDWWFDHPSVTINGNGNTPNESINFNQTFDMNTISTFDVYADWHFTRRQHFVFGVTQYDNTKSATLDREITFNGITYNVGSVVSANLKATTYAPGYQFDLLRNGRGHLGIMAQLNMEDVSAKLTGEGTITNTGTGESATAIRTAEGSQFVPIPVLGPEFKYLFIKDSPKYYVEGYLKGMYFFGYGNFISTRGIFGANLWKGLDATAGYQMGSRLDVNGTSDRLDIRFTQRGPVAGLAYKW